MENVKKCLKKWKNVENVENVSPGLDLDHLDVLDWCCGNIYRLRRQTASALACLQCSQSIPKEELNFVE